MRKRKCGVCGKEIEIKREKLSMGQSKNTEIYSSEEGVYFEDGNVWFCNDCWDYMTKDIFKLK